MLISDVTMVMLLPLLIVILQLKMIGMQILLIKKPFQYSKMIPHAPLDTVHYDMQENIHT